nr:hypothetical protein [Tanacetum cinerariifolium]
MANADNANRNPEPREAHVARKCSYKEFMSYQPFNFKGLEGTTGLISWFEHTELVFSHRNCTKDCKGNDLKTYVRRFQELATLCPTMVSDSEKLLEAFIGGLPRSIKGNVTASKPQTLEEDINIAQRLIGSDEKRLEDIPVVKEFPDVFPEDLPGLPPVRQVEFQINLIPGTAPVARAPYRLAPSEMQDLSNQLQELIDIGFIRPKVRQFLGLTGYYQRFIEGFLKIAKPLTKLTQKHKKYIWEEDQDSAFQLLKLKLCKDSILGLPEGNDDFVVYCDASLQGLGAVLMQKEKVITYAS